jgi:hypothetical protein
MGYSLLQSQTAMPLIFKMRASSDHIAALTGAAPTVVISKNGGNFGSPSGAVTEIGNGWYKVAGNATDTATLGPIALYATAASGDPADEEFEVVAYNPQAATNLGLTNLDAASSTLATSAALTAVSSSLSTVGTNVSTVLSRIGSFTGSGLNTILGFFRALANKTAALTPSDLTSGGSTFDNTTDSLEAQQEHIGSPSQTGEAATALATTTYAEPASVPAATSSLKDKIGWLMMLGRNPRTQTSSTETVLADNGITTVGTSTKSDDGTTFTRGKYS